MGVITHRRQAVGKLSGIRLPVTHRAKPSGIDVKQFTTERRRIVNHAPGERLIHRHAAAPAVVHHQRIARVGCRRAQMVHDKKMQPVGAVVHVAAITADEHRGRDETFAFRQAAAKFTF